MRLFRVTSKRFVAGFVVDDRGIVTKAAPIVRRYLYGMHIDNVMRFYHKKWDWIITEVQPWNSPSESPGVNPTKEEPQSDPTSGKTTSPPKSGAATESDLAT